MFYSTERFMMGELDFMYRNYDDVTLFELQDIPSYFLMVLHPGTGLLSPDQPQKDEEYV